MDIEFSQTNATKRDSIIEKAKISSKKTSLRKLHLVIDFSQQMLEKDFIPNTLYMVLSKAIEFVEEFFELNPLSNLALSLIKDRKCLLQSNFKNNPSELISIMENLKKKNSTNEETFLEDLNKDSEALSTHDIPSGTVSMENVLKATEVLMADQPLYYAREVLVLLNSPNSRDANDLTAFIEKINKAYIIVNMLSLAGGTYVFQQICQKTRGKFEVAINEFDFKQKLMVGIDYQAYTSPMDRVVDKLMNTQFIVSFPQLVFKEGPVLCCNTNQLL